MGLKEKIQESKLVSDVVITESAIEARQTGKTLLYCICKNMKAKDSQFRPDPLYRLFSEDENIAYLDKTIGVVFSDALATKIKYDILTTKQAIVFTIECKPCIGFKSDSATYRDMQLFTKSNCPIGTKIFLLSDEVYNSLNTMYIKPKILRDIATATSGTGLLQSMEDKSLDDTSSVISELINKTIKLALESRATDIQFKPSSDKGVYVVFTVDGIDKEIDKYENLDIRKLSRKIADFSDITNTQTNITRSGKMTRTLDGKDIEIRVNIVPSLYGDDIKLRILSGIIPDMSVLGMSSEMEILFKKALEQTKGLILLTGPMGSGKSTTAYAGLVSLLGKGRSIGSIEDPIEIKIDQISQFEITKDMSWGDYIESLLRHNLKIIFIGEIRNTETAKAAAAAAATGTLVIASLHTNSAPSSTVRLANMGIPRDVIAECLSVVISQRLIRRVCPECSEVYELPADHEWREIFNLGDGVINLKRGLGCPKCQNTGYYGRIVIQEFLKFDKDLRRHIEKGLDLISLEEEATTKHGYKPLLEDGVAKALQMLTTFDELIPIYNDII